MNNGCKIQLLDFYFSRCEFIQTRSDLNEEYTSSYKVNYAENSTDPSKVKITIDTFITNKTNSINIKLQTIGIFKIDNYDIDKETYDILVKNNTVAIMFPFIRSQVSLLSTQPGIKPIMIPPININDLLNKSNK